MPSMQCHAPTSGDPAFDRAGEPTRAASGGPGTSTRTRRARELPVCGDAAAPDRLAGRALRGYQPEIAHELARAVEAAEITEFGHEDHRGDELTPRIAWKALLDDRRHRPGRRRSGPMPLEPLQLLSGIPGRVESLLQDDMVRGVGK